MVDMKRRGFLKSLAIAAVAAPMIVRSSVAPKVRVKTLEEMGYVVKIYESEYGRVEAVEYPKDFAYNETTCFSDKRIVQSIADTIA